MIVLLTSTLLAQEPNLVYDRHAEMAKSIKFRGGIVLDPYNLSPLDKPRGIVCYFEENNFTLSYDFETNNYTYLPLGQEEVRIFTQPAAIVRITTENPFNSYYQVGDLFSFRFDHFKDEAIFLVTCKGRPVESKRRPC